MSENIEQKPVQIFDLDGTLTIEFDRNEGDRTGEGLDTYNYWHRITRKLADNPDDFDRREKSWLDMVMATRDIDMFQALIIRTEMEINRFDESNRNDAAIRREADLLTQSFFRHGILELDAIEYLKYLLNKGVVCVISTGGDTCGAAGFIDGLVNCGLLPENLAARIFVSGTLINWNKMTIEHLNVGFLKLKGLESVLQQPLAEIVKRTEAVFINDPEKGDRALAEDVCPVVFVKKTVKNIIAVLPPNGVFFSSWREIHDARDDIDSLHARLKSSS